MSKYPNNSAYYDPYDFNTKWADIDVHLTYQFDNEPTNIVMTGQSQRGGTGGKGTNGYYNDLYQVSFRLQNKQLKGYQSWMNWFEKIQPDYKFLVVDEKNSQTVVFQNVDDPWMFTQYIYKGVGKVYNPFAGEGEATTKSQDYLIIQPGLYDEYGKPINQAAKDMDVFLTYTTQEGGSEQIKTTSFKKVRERGWYKPQYGDYQKSRYTTGVDGSVLYRGEICVQSNKWGQHGNVPAHAINMMAPKDYVQGNTKLVLRAIKKTTYGIPIYVDQFGYGYITTKDDKFYIVDDLPEPDEANEKKDQYGNIQKLASAQYDVPTNGSGVQILKTMTKTTSPKIKCRMIGTDITSGQVVYNGCKYFGVLDKTSDNKTYVGCMLQKNMSLQQKQYAKCCADCKTKNKACKYFVQRGKTIAYRYQCLPTSYRDDDDSNSQLNNLAWMLAVGGGVVGGVMAVQIIAMQQNNKYFREAGGFSKTTQTTYEYVQQPLNGIQVQMPANTENNKGAVVIRGTGQSAFEKPGLPVRKIYDGDMSQINYHRWLNRILPCYNKKFCNPTVGFNQTQKTPMCTNSGCTYMDVNQQNQIINKTVPFCPYYKQDDKNGIGCPYSTVNKTAMDYARITNFFYDSFYSSYALPISNFYLNAARNEETLSDLTYVANNVYANVVQNSLEEGTGQLVIKVYYSFYRLEADRDPQTGQVILITHNEKNFVSTKQAIVKLSKMFGLQQSVLQKSQTQVDSSVAGGKEGDFFLCTVRLKAENYVIAKKQIIQFVTDKDGDTKEDKQITLLVDMFIKYDVFDLGDYSQSGLVKPTFLKQWFVRVQKCSLPRRDPTVIDNEIKFLGGYHPQYSAYPATPQEILYKKEVAYTQQLKLQEKADENEWGHSPTTSGKQVQYGYFVKQNGDWLLDGEKIGTPITGNCEDSIQGRAESPSNSYNGGTCIGNRWENTLIDPQAEKPIQKQIANCIFYTNDTASSIEYLINNPPQIQTQNSDKPVKVPVSITYPQALPLQRSNYAYCADCDTVLALRFLAIEFDNPPKDQIAQNGNMKCPWCGKGLTPTGKGSATKIPRTKAMGRVVVWGLPGTIIKTDSYFWKSPVMVNNALISQMSFKLGKPSVFGGGYSMTNANADSEKIDSVPFQEQVGIYKQGIKGAIYQQLFQSDDDKDEDENNNSNGEQDEEKAWYDKATRIASNPSLPQDILSSVGLNSKVDNRIINPFDDELKTEGLKMVSADYITSLRNLLQPALGYYVGKRTVRAGESMLANGDVLSQFVQSPNNPGEYQLYRVKYDDRKQLSYLKKWVKKRSACYPLILAYCGNEDNQTSCKVQYPSGDNQIGELVKYYPPDPKWWFKRQYVGGINLTLSGNPYHFDREKFYADQHNNYSGLKSSMVSECYILPHGFVPLDKQVVAAYLYFNGSQVSCYEPSLGQVQYPSGVRRIIYLHFHPYTTQHESYGTQEDGTIKPHKHEMDDNLVYDDHYDFDNESDVQRFKEQRNIIDLDDIGPNADVDINKKKLVSYFDKYGDKYYIDQKTGLPIYYRLFEKKYPQYFIQTQDIHQFQWMQDNLLHSSMATKTNMKINAAGINYTHQSKNFGNSPLPDCLRWDGFGTDIIQTKSQNQIWKNYTKEQFEKMQDRYLSHVNIQIDAGDGNVTNYSFDQYYSQFNGVLQQEMQSIPGYFDFSQFNSSGYLKKYQNKSKNDTIIQGNYEQFIVTQAAANVNTNTGNGDHMVDITNQFKSIYNDREERKFLGAVSQKSIQATLTASYTSKWTGVSEQQSDQSINWSTNFNDRLTLNGYYVLNANYWYPNLNEDGVPQYSINGQKIQFNLSKLYVSYYTKNYYQITNGSNQITINCSVGDKTANKTFDISEGVTSIDSKTLASYMSETLQDANAQGVVIQQSAGNIVIHVSKVMRQNEAVYADVSFDIVGVDEPPTFEQGEIDCNRVVSFSGFKNGKHPKQLTHFAKSGVGMPNPTSKGWQNRSIHQEPQYIVFDLIQLPFEKQRRDYLADKGSVSYQDSKCKNADCPAYNQLQGIYTKMRGSKANNTCLGCGGQLQEVKKNCDGINSWWYHENPQNDVVIAGLQLQMMASTSTTPKAPVSIYVSSDNQRWDCILSLTMKNGTQVYSDIYLTQDCSNSKMNTFDGGVIDFLNYSVKKAGEHGKLIRGRYLKIVSMPQPYTVACSADTYTFGNNYIFFNSEKIYQLYVSDGQLRGQKVAMELKYVNQSDEQIEVILYRTVRNNVGSMIYIDPVDAPDSKTGEGIQPPKISNIRMNVTLYYSGIKTLKIYGGGYSKSKLVITPPPNQLSGEYNWKVPVNIIPLKFFKVAACVNNYQQYPLTQILSYNDIQSVGFQLQVVSESFIVPNYDDDGILINTETQVKNIQYYIIKDGKFYFDVGKKRLLLPRYGYASSMIFQKVFGEEGASQQIKRSEDQFQKVNYNGKQMYQIPFNYFDLNLSKWGIYKNLTPTHYTVTLWDGSQAGVQIKVEAEKRGPCAQVEKGAICQFDAATLSKLPASGSTTPLPNSITSAYQSYQQVNKSTSQIASVPWIVYNKQMATVPQKSTPYEWNRGNFMMNLAGTQLYQKNADYWYKNIVRENCEGFIGNVQAVVTLKGKPNTCIYLGQNQKLVVKAPIQKTRYIGNIKVKQRTGGLKKGLRISPEVTGSQRAANAYNMPYIIVYLKQRYVDDDLG